MIKIAICDDIPEWISDLEELIKQYEFKDDIDIYIYKDGNELLGEIDAIRFDVVFMDIELESDNGIDWGKKLKDKSQDTILVYISCHMNYFRQLTESEPFDFIKKPFIKERVFKTLDRICERLERKKKKYFSFDFNGKTYNIDLRNVIYFCSQHRIIIIHTEKQDFKFYDKLDNVQNEIDSITNMFIRVNKSYYINMEKIETFTMANVFVDNEQISVGKKYVKDYMNKILNS